MKRRLQRLYLPHLRLILELALNILLLWQSISQIGWLRPWLLPERRSMRVHMVDDRRHHLPVWIVMVHFLTTLITWALVPPTGLALWFRLLVNRFCQPCLQPVTLERRRAAVWLGFPGRCLDGLVIHKGLLMSELEQGIAALKAGQRDEARRLLAAAIRQTPNNERAWLWMYNGSNNDQERQHCLEQALRINPKNEKAKQLLFELQQKNSQPPVGAGMSDDEFAEKMRGWLNSSQAWPEMDNFVKRTEKQMPNQPKSPKIESLNILAKSMQSVGCLLTIFVSIPACLCLLYLLIQSK